jgi:molecular chaperone DnaK
MANQNRVLGRFDLVGIPPAPRGVPQIEVTFDIDANGIVHVSAKDLGTGKEQKIRIESSSGLSDNDIDRMVKEAELHAEEDKKEREKAEVRNEADTMIYGTEKNIKDLGNKVNSADKASAEEAIADLRRTLEGGDIEAIKAKTEALKQISYKIAEEVYKQTGAQGGAGPGPEAAGGGETGGGGGNNTKSAEDADYEVVDDGDK